MPDMMIDKIGKDAELNAEIDARFKYCESNYAAWIKAAKKDYKFSLGDQWTDEERQILESEARPCLTFNRIRPIINIISGYQRDNSPRIKVSPEGGEDRVFSEVMDRALAFVDKIGKLDYKMAYQFDDGLYCGKGNLEAILDYTNDPIRGEIKFIQLSPYQLFVDPDCREYDINEAEFVFKVCRFTKTKLKALYPDKAKLIDGFKTDSDDWQENSSGIQIEGADDDYGNRPNVTTTAVAREEDDESEAEGDEKFTLKEYWRFKYVDRYYVIDPNSGEPVKFEKKDEADAFAAKVGMEVVKRQAKETWVAARVCGFVIQDIKSPFEPFYTGYPFFPFMAEWAPNAEEEVLRVQGITRALIDPQKEKNKAKSQNLHILNTQANSGWIGDDNALTDEGKKALEKMGSKAGLTVWKRPGTELREILPKGPNQGHLAREQMADEEFKQISGVNPDLLGMKEDSSSGKAIMLRIKQGVLSLARTLTNYRYTKETIGRFVLLMLPKILDSKKLSKIIGEDFMRGAVSERYPEGISVGVLDAFLQMVKDQKYDVSVAEGNSSATIRYETFQQLTEMAQAGIPIPPTLLIDFMDIPNADKIKEQIAQQQAAQQQAAMAKKGA